jgi:serine/threonine protein kinase
MAGLEGARLGAYELIERIGGGGMADVYRAKQTTAFDREVAVKVIRSGFSEDRMFRERFLREAQAIAKLSHPNILPLIEFGQERDILYLVMPYAPGGTLRDLITRVNGPLSLNDTVEIFTQLCDAVQYAHEQGIVHRDIKPQNVLIQRGKHLLLADFGIARDASDTKLTMTGAGVGTVEYMAPEQAMGQSDTRSDLYSLGIVLYQMLTGRVPFGGSTPFEIMMKQAKEPLTPARSLNPALPREIDSILDMALAKDPNKRFQSATSLLRAVQNLQQNGRSQNNINLAPGSAPDLQRSASARSGPPSFPGASRTGERGFAASRSGPGSGAGFSPASSGGPPSLPRGARPGGPAFSEWDDAAPTRQRSPEIGFYGDQGGRSGPPGWGGRPSGPPPPAYPQDDTFMTDAPPPRRPTNPGYGYSGSPSRPGSMRASVDPQAWVPDEPKKRGNFWLLLAAAVLLVAALGIGGVVVVNLKNKQNTANQPGIAQTTTGTSQTPATATPVSPGKASYAFMSNFQIFVSLQGQTPKQFTNIPEVGQPNAALGAGINTDFLASPLLFSPDGRYVAGLIQIVDAPRDGLSGGNLYIIDTQTGKVIQPTEPGSTKALFSNGGANAITWKDGHTLIIAGDPNTTHVRAYDINTDSYTVAFNPVNPPAGSVIVRGHYIFYSNLVPESGASANDLILHRYDMNSKADQALFKLGTVSAPEGPVPAPDGYAPFDISPDGAHILWRGFAPGGNTDGLWYAGIDGSSPKQLLNGIDLGAGGFMENAPAISPDGKKGLLQTEKAVYTVNLDGSNLQKYADFGQPDWLPDSSGITVVVSTDSTGLKFKTDQCKPSDGSCNLLLNNASGFYWQK